MSGFTPLRGRPRHLLDGFAACSAATFNHGSPGTSTVALGLALLSAIHAFGGISGGHFKPAMALWPWPALLE